MEKIKSKLFSTGKKCLCGGKIKEMVSLKDSNEISKNWNTPLTLFAFRKRKVLKFF